MAINVNESGVVKGITTDITAFISAIDLIAEDLPFTRGTIQVLSLDYTYRFLLILHAIDPSVLSTSCRIGSQLVYMKNLIIHADTKLIFSSVVNTNSRQGYTVMSDATGRQITLTCADSADGSPTITILGVR